MSLLPRRLIRSQGLGLVLGLLAVPAARSQNGAETPFQATPLAQRQPLSVGAFTDAYPYSYLDADGRLAGFSVDVLDAVARAVNLQITRVLGPAVQIRQRFQNGEFEMLQYHGITLAPVPFAEFSVPYLSLQGCIFVRSGGPIKSLQDLNGQDFGMIGTTGEGEKLLRDNHVRARVVRVASQEALLERISSGEIAAGFVSQLSELSVARRQHLKNLVMLGRPYNDYEIRQAFAVHAGDAELLARLNEGLAIIHRSGEYDRIYRKNFSQYGSYILSSDELEFYVSITLAFGFVVVLWGYFRQRRLRQELSVQAARLAEQGALLQALYDNIPMAMTVIEARPSGPVVLSMNRESCSLYAIDFTARGEPLDALDVSPEIRQLLAQAAGRSPGADVVSKREVILKSGKRILEVTSVPLVSPEGVQTSRICVLVEDITERKKQESEVVRSRKLRAVGELVGGIAHEFNNLLTPVMLKAGEIQMSRPDDAELQQDVEVIAQAVQRTAELTRRLLTFGRKADHRSETVRLSAIAAGCFDLLRNTVDRRIVWESSIPADLPPLYVNATDLNQIILNLLLNARDALLERLSGRNPVNWVPKIMIEGAQLAPGAFEAPAGHAASALLGWQLITVRDTGLGMPPDVVERIFEPFFTTKDVGKGTGLGLATVWHLVTGAGGRVKVESALGAGSTFQIYLPVWPAVDRPATAAVERKAGRRVRILLIEDETLVASPLIQILERSGHTVRYFENGLEAWKHLDANLGAYDLLIVDVNLPGMNGIDIVARAREREFAGRIFMVSGRFTSSDMSALTRLRIDHSLTKPFNVQQFLQAVQDSLEVARAQGLLF
jgi:signal transduction histidine kinase/ABC-type amino acid transport substrate-binding protein/ActR/RegA family two-component response regulator